MAVAVPAVYAAIGAGLAILLGNGDGTFATPVNYYSTAGLLSIAVGDFNGDGKADPDEQRRRHLRHTIDPLRRPFGVLGCRRRLQD